jgi:hypothetical protein
MEYKLLVQLAKIAGIGGVSIGLVIVLISKVLTKRFLSIFPKAIAAWLVIISITLTWSTGILGLLVWANSDIKTKTNSSQKSEPNTNIQSHSSVESHAQIGTYIKSPKDTSPNISANSKVDENNIGYKSTDIVSSKTKIESEQKESASGKEIKSGATSFSTLIPISILNTIFSLFFSISLIWTIFILSGLYFSAVLNGDN